MVGGEEGDGEDEGEHEAAEGYFEPVDLYDFIDAMSDDGELYSEEDEDEADHIADSDFSDDDMDDFLDWAGAAWHADLEDHHSEANDLIPNYDIVGLRVLV